jgi:hypothetical protein
MKTVIRTSSAETSLTQIFDNNHKNGLMGALLRYHTRSVPKMNTSMTFRT